MSFKRRRGIGIRKWLVSALKDYSKREDVPSHTAAVNRILRGKLAPIRDYEIYKNGGDNTKQGVSMPEELWLALKDYASFRGKGESYTKVACKILVGKIGPVPSRSIEEGKRLARLRESERAERLGIPIIESASEPKVEAANDAHASVEPEPAAPVVTTPATLSEPVTDPKVEPKPKRKKKAKKAKIAQRESEPSQEEIILAEREDSERTDERGRPLSHGVPVAEKALEKKINPDDDSYGGVFNL